MSKLFLELLNISISASWIVLIIVTLRLVLKRTSKWIICLMWSVAGLRLVLPFSIESPISLLPSNETINDSMFYGRIVVQSGVSKLDEIANTYLGENYCEGITAPIDHFENIMHSCGWIWIIGMVILMLYGVISYTYLRMKVNVSLPYKDNIYFCETIDSPFAFGLFSTKIYLPMQMDEKDQACAILHEQAHVSRHDTIWKLISSVLIAIHWFNPIIWLAYILMNRDLEYACDERVIGKMDLKEKKRYSAALIACKKSQSPLLGSPVAFGEISVKRRILTVLTYKRPDKKMQAISLFLCLLISACFLTDPLDSMREYNIPSVMLSAEHFHESVIYRPAPVHTEVTTYRKFEMEQALTVDSCKLSGTAHEHQIGVWTKWNVCEGCGKECGRSREKNVEYCPQNEAIFAK